MQSSFSLIKSLNIEVDICNRYVEVHEVTVYIYNICIFSILNHSYYELSRAYSHSKKFRPPQYSLLFISCSLRLSSRQVCPQISVIIKLVKHESDTISMSKILSANFFSEKIISCSLV